MSKFFEKLFRGENADRNEWVEHLLEAHRKSPGMTSAAFAGHRSSDGLNSYEILSSVLEAIPGRKATVVDLACGDGHLMRHLSTRVSADSRLIGIDMSEEELSLARKAHGPDPRVTFHLTRAHAVPLESGVTDAVLCHMAFMLMSPIEPVVGEIARVLRPGGLFAAIVGDPIECRGVLAETRQLIGSFIKEKFPKMAQAQIGDARASTQTGWMELFNSRSGFTGVQEFRPFTLDCHLSPEGVWNFIKDMYFVGALDENLRDELKTRVIDLARRSQGADGGVLLQQPMRLGIARRNG